MLYDSLSKNADCCCFPIIRHQRNKAQTMEIRERLQTVLHLMDKDEKDV